MKIVNHGLFITVLILMITVACTKKPTACFTTNIPEGTIDKTQSVICDASCSEYADSYHWLKGPVGMKLAGNGESKKETYSFSNPGAYEITLSIWNGLNNSKITKTFQVNDPKKKYDGTYNWSLSNVGGINSSCFDCATIINGNLTVDGTFCGPISVDNFKNITFYSPACPNGNNSKGTFTGFNGGTTFYAWQGTWTCNDGSIGGANSVWKLFQQ